MTKNNVENSENIMKKEEKNGERKGLCGFGNFRRKMNSDFSFLVE